MKQPCSDSSDLLRYHRPKLRLEDAPIPRLSGVSKQCLQNLTSYRAPSTAFVFPRARRAAVLVALFVGRMGDLYVLLNRRASTLRSYAGDTSLPGGKYEPDDRSLEETARREAFEEIGLSPDRDKVPLLCILEPFLVGNHLIVTPVVVLILDNTLRPVLNAAEVHSLFSHPLRGFLSSDSPFPPDPADAGPAGSATYHTVTDIAWAGDPTGARRVRMHRFLTGREEGGTKPVYGLTAAILIRTACIALRQPPLFELYAPGQPSMAERFAHVFLADQVFRAACLAENIDPDRVLRDVKDEVHAEKVKRRGAKL